MHPGRTDPKQRLPWIVAGGAIIFALVVLIRSELSPEGEAPVRSVPTPTPRHTPRAPDLTQATPAVPAPSPSVAANAPPVSTPAPTATPAAPTFSLSGIVTDNDGKPLPNAAVRATYSIGASQQSANAKSAADGTFKLEGLRAASLDVVLVEAVGYGRTVIEKLPLPLVDPLEVALTALAGLDVSIEHMDADSRKPYEGEADFVLFQQRESSPSTATLGLKEAALPADGFVAVARQHVNVTGGQLRLEELEPGIYKAGISVKSKGTGYAESLPVTVEGSGRSQTTVSLGLTHTLTGAVAAEGDSRPLDQATVLVSFSGSYPVEAMVPDKAGVTDAAGYFAVSGVAPGTYSLTIGANGYTTKTVAGLQVSTVAPPPETTYTLTQQQPQVKVTVLDGDGRPMSQARLVLMMMRPVSKSVFSVTDEAGTKTFEGISPGFYSLAVTSPGERARQKSIELNLEDSPTTDVQIAFPKTAAVRGHARRNGAAYKGLVAFTLRGTVGLQQMAKADETGSYIVELEPGEYMVGTPEEPNSQVVNVRPDQTGNIDVELK